jgi:Fe-S cluster biogenesis protein NfuA
MITDCYYTEIHDNSMHISKFGNVGSIYAISHKCIYINSLMCHESDSMIPNVHRQFTGDFHPFIRVNIGQVKLVCLNSENCMVVFWKTACNACKIELQQVKAWHVRIQTNLL